MSRARGALCRACLALAAALAALLLLPLPRAPAPAPAPAAVAAPSLRPDDVFIAVKTTRKNHGPRLGLLLRTWISRARPQVPPARLPARGSPAPSCARRPKGASQSFFPQTFIFTDGDDPELQQQAGEVPVRASRVRCQALHKGA